MAGSDPDNPSRSGAVDEEVLRAKYLDYCSAQVADLLLFLSPDDIFVLAQKAARERGDGDELSYMRMVQIATDFLSRKMTLPPFDVWVGDYLEHPDRYEDYFMGLWESELTRSEE